MIPTAGVEDPISATFDLADEVASKAPTVRRLYRYTATILVLWIVIMAVVTIATFSANALWLSILAIVALIAGVIALGLLRETDQFFREFVKRHRAIRLVRDAEPTVRIPEGRTPIERLARHLAASNPRVEALLRKDPSALRYKVSLGAGVRDVEYDLLVEKPASSSWRVTGWGDPGFAVIARVGPDAPTSADLRKIGAEAAEVAARLPAQLVRLILLRTSAPPLPEDVYEYAVGHPVEVRRGRSRFHFPIEIVTETSGGSYDFVPHVLGIP